MNLFIAFVIITAISHQVGLWKIFEKAGQKGILSLIPFYNYYILICKINGQKISSFIYLFVPIIGFITLYNLRTDTARSFGRFKFIDDVLSVMFFSYYVIYLGFKDDIKYEGQANSDKIKNAFKAQKSSSREWYDALFFAAVVATLVRTFYIEAYTIPTPSMEKTLLVGDYLFVSKAHYGARIPITPLAFPFAHHTMPILGTKAYSELIKLPYMRLPGFQKIRNNDIVVFNWPVDKERNPIDKKENYVKRCVAIGGDTIEIKNSQLYVNGIKAWNPENLEHYYVFKSNSGLIPNNKIIEKYNIGNDQGQTGSANGLSGYFLTENALNSLKQNGFADSIFQHEDEGRDFAGIYYPTNKNYTWSANNFGPLWIPAEGSTIVLNERNFDLYGLVIKDYEENESFEKSGNDYILNGNKVTEYTFKQNYYWLMGDNRDNSSDSRVWGFVPEQNVVGKPVFIWYSKGENGIRWNRIMRPVDHRK